MNRNGSEDTKSTPTKSLLIRVGDDGESVSFSTKEVELFDKLFRIVDSNEDGVVEGALGAAFLRRSELSDAVLRDIWRLASGGKSKPSMTRESWFVAMKLTGLAQSRSPPKVEMGPLLAKVYIPAPNFGFTIERVVETAVKDAVKISPDSARIRIQKPSVKSSNMGLTGHTLYEVFTKTSLPHFVFREMHVRRRFKEFEWLRSRLSRRYLGCVIPKLPKKRVYGNFEPVFVEERRLELQLFLNYVIRHPLLTKSLELEIFLSASRQGLADAQDLTASSAESVVVASSSTVTSALGSIVGLFSSSTSLRSSSSFKRRGSSGDGGGFRSETDGKRSEELRDAVDGLTKDDEKFAKAISAVERLVRAERRFAASMKMFADANEKAANVPENPHANIVGIVARTAAAAAAESRHFPAATTSLVLTPTRFYGGLIRATSEIESNRELLRQDFRDAVDMQQSATDFNASIGSSMGRDGEERAQRRSRDADARVSKARRDLEAFSNSAIEEVNRIQRSRKIGLARCTSRFAAAQAKIAGKMREHWKGAAGALAGDTKR